MIEPSRIDTSWTLFLDRDGVINVRLPGDYVKTPAEFVFTDGTPEAIATLSHIFGRIIVVTNQRGIAVGVMTHDDLEIIHRHMTERIIAAGGRVDAIFYCPHDRDENCGCRKPSIGMALKAKELFPDIDFSRSIIAGDSSSDMKFGENAGMLCARIAGKAGDQNGSHPFFASLAGFLDFIRGTEKE